MTPVYKFSTARSITGPNTYYSSVLAGNSVFGSAPPNAFDLLATETLTTNTSIVTFSNLDTAYSANYRHLHLRWLARSNRSNQTADGAVMRINGATSGYSQHNLRGDGSTFAAYGGSANEIGWTLLPAPNYTTDRFAFGYMDILDAFETTKNTTTRGIWCFGTEGVKFLSHHSSAYLSTDPVSTISFEPNEGTGMIAGTRFSLYGLKGE